MCSQEALRHPSVLSGGAWTQQTKAQASCLSKWQTHIIACIKEAPLGKLKVQHSVKGGKQHRRKRKRTTKRFELLQDSPKPFQEGLIPQMQPELLVCSFQGVPSKGRRHSSRLLTRLQTTAMQRSLPTPAKASWPASGPQVSLGPQSTTTC